MKVVTAILLALSSMRVFAGFAPETIANNILRMTLQVPSVRTDKQSTVILGADGRYTKLRVASWGYLAPFDQKSFFLNSSGGTGDYTYEKTGDNTATLNLGLTEYSLEFSSPTRGSPDHRFTFTLTDIALIDPAPALNFSLLGHVIAGHPLRGEFVVPGSKPGVNVRDVLIRVVGPSLTPLGFVDVWDDPDFELHGAGTSGLLGYHYSDWSNLNHWWGETYYESGNWNGVLAFNRIFEYVGAFPLLEGSKDAARVVQLAPGAYTVVARAEPDDPGGQVLIEVFFLDNDPNLDPLIGGSLVDGQGDWFLSDWFGYYTSFAKWIYHAEHGWLYRYDLSSNASMYVYDDAMGAWWWTSQTLYPFIYVFDPPADNTGTDIEAEWLFYFEGSMSPRSFSVTGDSAGSFLFFDP